MANKIQVDLELAIKKLGFKNVDQAFKQNPGLVNAIARGLGGSVEEAMAQGISKSGSRTPPVIPHDARGIAGIFQKFDRMLTGSGGLLSGFGRYEIGRSAMDALGLGGGVTGRLGGAAFMSLGNKIPNLTAAVVAGTLALDAFKVALHRIIEAIEQGAKLFQQSRALGVSTGRTASFLNALGIVGIDPSMAMRLASYGEFGRRGGGIGGQSVSGMLVSSGRSAGMGPEEIQQIINMRKELDYAFQMTAQSSREMTKAASINFDTAVQWRIFKEDFSAFWQQISALASPVLQKFIQILDVFVRLSNVGLEMALALERSGIAFARIVAGFVSLVDPSSGALLRALLPPNVPHSTPQRVGGSLRQSHFSALERMGLVIGGTDRSVQHLQNIDTNTRHMISQLGIIAGRLGQAPHNSLNAP